MKRKLMPVLLAILMAAFAIPMAHAQCVPSYPDVIPVGSSACIQLCPGDFVIINLEGNVIGPEGVPVLTFQAGCAAAATNCDVACTGIVPPFELIFGGDPFYPDDYYGESECLVVYLRWAHTNVWVIEIFSVCDGCFCLTFDRQLSVNLSSFTALSADREVTLNWITASESGNDHFDIERDGEKIAEVDATNLASGDSYSYTDRDLVNGRSYAYTLSMVDVNGNRQVGQTINASPTFGNAVVSQYALHQNYPNPFNPETSIAFDLVESGNVKLAIYNVLGETVATLVNGTMSSGRHTVVFNGSNLTSGVYLYKLEVNGFSDTKKFVLLK